MRTAALVIAGLVLVFVFAYGITWFTTELIKAIVTSGAFPR